MARTDFYALLSKLDLDASSRTKQNRLASVPCNGTTSESSVQYSRVSKSPTRISSFFVFLFVVLASFVSFASFLVALGLHFGIVFVACAPPNGNKTRETRQCHSHGWRALVPTALYLRFRRSPSRPSPFAWPTRLRPWR